MSPRPPSLCRPLRPIGLMRLAALEAYLVVLNDRVPPPDRQTMTLGMALAIAMATHPSRAYVPSPTDSAATAEPQ